MWRAWPAPPGTERGRGSSLRARRGRRARRAGRGVAARCRPSGERGRSGRRDHRPLGRPPGCRPGPRRLRAAHARGRADPARGLRRALRRRAARRRRPAAAVGVRRRGAARLRDRVARAGADPPRRARPPVDGADGALPAGRPGARRPRARPLTAADGHDGDRPAAAARRTAVDDVLGAGRPLRARPRRRRPPRPPAHPRGPELPRGRAAAVGVGRADQAGRPGARARATGGAGC